MPMYDYKCPCGRKETKFLKIAQCMEPQQCAVCSAPMVKQVAAPAVRGDIPGYACPVSGAWIEGRRAHEENLARHGCRVLESGETDAVVKFRAAQEEALDRSVEETTDQFISELPARKREQLTAELEHGFDVQIERQAVTN